MIIGLISDTHGYLEPRILEYFQPCHEIWHAGDIGSNEVLDALEQLKPTHAVYGNIDDQQIRRRCKEDLWLERSGLRILLTHIAGIPGRYTPRVKAMLALDPPDILICGHSHIAKVTKDPQTNNMMHINPGAAGRQGLHQVKTIMRITLEANQITNLEIIELGKRGAI